MSRPNRIENFFAIVDEVRKRSHDAQTQVGALCVKQETNAIIATGCNGYVRGAPDDHLPNTRPEKYEYILHAEENLIANCAHHGISMEGCFVVLSVNPCIKCTRLLYQCGITRVLCREVYPKYFQPVLEMHDLRVDVNHFQEAGFYELTISPRHSDDPILQDHKGA